MKCGSITHLKEWTIFRGWQRPRFGSCVPPITSLCSVWLTALNFAATAQPCLSCILAAATKFGTIYCQWNVKVCLANQVTELPIVVRQWIVQLYISFSMSLAGAVVANKDGKLLLLLFYFFISFYFVHFVYDFGVLASGWLMRVMATLPHVTRSY